MGQEYELKGRKLKCQFCGSEKFSTKKSLLNTRVLTFFKWDWADQSADNYICEDCGYIMWFLHK